MATAHIFTMSCIRSSQFFGLGRLYFLTILPWTEKEVVKGGGVKEVIGKEKGIIAGEHEAGFIADGNTEVRFLVPMNHA